MKATSHEVLTPIHSMIIALINRRFEEECISSTPTPGIFRRYITKVQKDLSSIDPDNYPTYEEEK